MVTVWFDEVLLSCIHHALQILKKFFATNTISIDVSATSSQLAAMTCWRSVSWILVDLRLPCAA